MRTYKSDNAHKSASASTPVFQNGLNGAFTDAVERSATAFGQNIRTLQNEGMRFMTRRVEENLRTAEEFGKCKSLPELFAAQQKWFADMTRAYSEEWVKCGELLSRAMHETAQVSGNGRDSAHSDQTD